METKLVCYKCGKEMTEEEFDASVMCFGICECNECIREAFSEYTTYLMQECLPLQYSQEVACTATFQPITREDFLQEHVENGDVHSVK